MTVETIVEASSLGSIKLLIYRSNPAVVDNKLLVTPTVVEISVGVDKYPPEVISARIPPVVDKRLS